jgi:hypothetical protein
MATSFSGGRSQREPPTMGKQLVNLSHLQLRVECTINQSTIPTSMSVTNNKSIHNSYIHVCNKQYILICESHGVMKIKSFTNVQGIQWVPSRMGPKFNNAM